MGKYIPGNPSVIVENMTGAGSLIAANHIYRVAKADGLTIGAFNGNHILGQLLAASATSFDPRKMEWMGAPGNNHDLCVLNQKTGIANAEQWLASKTPLKLAGSAPGTTTDDTAKVLKEAIGIPMRLISGYKGTADMRVAVEAGEVDGLCGFSSRSIRSKSFRRPGKSRSCSKARRRHMRTCPRCRCRAALPKRRKHASSSKRVSINRAR